MMYCADIKMITSLYIIIIITNYTILNAKKKSTQYLHIILEM